MSLYYETFFSDALRSGLPESTGADLAATAFLDGKPDRNGKSKITATERHAAFWSASFLQGLPKEAWTQESLVLALAHYLRQDHFAFPAIVSHVATLAPEAVQRAARYAGLVLRQDSPRWKEVAALADTHPANFGEYVQIFGILRQAHEVRVAEVAQTRQPLTNLTPLELLAYASLYAFEHLIPGLLEGAQVPGEPNVEETWSAIEDIMAWKLATCDPASLRLNNSTIGTSLGTHLSPFLFPSREGPPPRNDLYSAFSTLVDAQVELNSFVIRSAEAFCYDDTVRFFMLGERLEIVEKDATGIADWHRDGDKLTRLHQYWLYRGMAVLMKSPDTLALVGPEHLEANLQAFAKAMGTWQQLQEVYGLAEHVQTEAGSKVDVFRSLLAIELMTAFFIEEFLLPYQEYLRQFGHPWLALGCLAFSGLTHVEMQNRLPITWSDKTAKIAKIKPWTVSTDYPHGQERAAEAILDFWTCDWIALADQLHRGDAGLRPRLHERPMLKMGRHLFQLPWMVAVQNNATAAINNLRRLGARRGDARDETRRIEQRLAALFAQRGFQVLVSHELPSLSADAPNGEEIDLLCARDGRLLVLEIKSTYLRRSVKESWTHRHVTLRKAGLQLHRKVTVVRRALEHGGSLRQALALEADCMPEIAAWIVDTSIECDHQRFHGFLKVSLEEVLIALRDDRHWLNDPDGLFQTGKASSKSLVCDSDRAAFTSLYPGGFSAKRFVEAIESAAVWNVNDGKSAQ
ncbi:hypothetical protein RHDC1_02316 [Rhodocyclaceae bacterium]|jgi:hypothetical protein|nr:hypothetical protein RHDC1_02316 [Rhodocyclaceae bacterium]